MSRPPKSNDLNTYLRLFTYLKGQRAFIAGVFVCMFLEGIFTVLTISSMKPLLDLLVNKRLTSAIGSTKHLPFEVTEPVTLSDGKIGLRAGGSLIDRHAAESFEEGVLAASRKPAGASGDKAIMADLEQIDQIGTSGWAGIWSAGEEAAAAGTRLQVVLPADIAPPQSFPQTAKVNFVTRSGLQAPAVAELDNLPLLKPARQPAGFFYRWKQDLAAKASPLLERVQEYSMRSSQHKFRVLGIIIAWMLFSAVCMALASFGVGYLSACLANRSVQRLRNHVFSHTLDLDMAYFNAHSTGNLMSTVLQDVAAVASAVDVLFSSVIKTPITVLMLVAAMFFISPSLTLFSFTVLPFMGYMLYRLGRRVRRVSSRVQKYKSLLSAVLEEAFGSIRVVKAFNMENYERERFEKQNRDIVRLTLKTKAAEEIGTGLTQIIGVFTISLMVLVGGYYVLRTGQLSGSEFVLFIGFLSQVFRPLKGVSKTNSRIQRGLAGCDRVFRVLDMQATIMDKPEAVELAPLRRAIEFQNISFGYSESATPVLRDINLIVPAGRAIALVGETGAGKSTLVNLLPRFYDPTAGAVLYDGVDLRDARIRSLRDKIAVITQDVILFDDTVANNIMYGSREPVTRAVVEAAARAAKAHDFIMARPEGYETLIGARGVRLSGGERQRIAIARAIVKNAPILILDEATSALDSETEALIQEALANVIRGRTVFVIAHRLSTIQNCSEIYVMDKGRIVEQGTHDELLARRGRYARYYEIQFGTKAVTAG